MVKNPEAHQRRRLLGKTKWTTLRTHALTIENTIAMEPEILKWQDRPQNNQVIHAMLDKILTQKLPPSRLRTIWTTINWTCKRIGYPGPGDDPDLQAPYDETSTRMEGAQASPHARRHGRHCTGKWRMRPNKNGGQQILLQRTTHGTCGQRQIHRHITRHTADSTRTHQPRTHGAMANENNLYRRQPQDNIHSHQTLPHRQTMVERMRDTVRQLPTGIPRHGLPIPKT